MAKTQTAPKKPSIPRREWIQRAQAHAEQYPAFLKVIKKKKILEQLDSRAYTLNPETWVDGANQAFEENS